MLRYLFILFFSLLFIGCGSDKEGPTKRVIASQNIYRSAHNAPKDPLYEDQWYLHDRFGIDIGNLWQNYLGDGIRLSVVDVGIDITHEDLKGSIDFDAAHRFSDNSNDPSPTTQELYDPQIDANHGTAVAGVIAAAHNGIGMMGIAPNVSLIPLNVFSRATDRSFVKAISLDDVDISSNSWGEDLSRGFIDDRLVLDAINQTMKKSPTIYLFSSGNEASNAEFSSLLTSRYTLVIGASTKGGSIAPYSNRGANLLCVAPGGGNFGLLTTDLTGEKFGYDTKWHHLNLPENSAYNYTDSFKGTSASTALVAGVVALMKEANPTLDYRDVRYIIAHTSRQIDPNHPSWIENDEGLYYSTAYGFGLIDAQKAVEEAKHFRHLPPIIKAQKALTKLSLPISSQTRNGVSLSFEIDQDFVVEYAVLHLDASYKQIGDLDLLLTSASGTQLPLLEHSPRFDTPLKRWDFGAIGYMDESAKGSWELRLITHNPHLQGLLRSASLTLYGHQK